MEKAFLETLEYFMYINDPILLVIKTNVIMGWYLFDWVEDFILMEICRIFELYHRETNLGHGKLSIF